MLQTSQACVGVRVPACVCAAGLESHCYTFTSKPLLLWVSYSFLEMCPFHLSFHIC